MTGAAFTLVSTAAAARRIIAGASLCPPVSLPKVAMNSTGGTVGGQIGYRWQATNWVFGLEGQGNWADFSGSNATPTGGNPFGGLTDRSRIDLVRPDHRPARLCLE